MHHMLMRTLLAVLLVPAVLPLWAQGVSAAEYFWDNDPGPGNGTAMTALDGGFGQAVEAILMETSTLPAPGPHKLGIRVRDAQQNWGPVFATLVVVDPSLTAVPEIRVTHAEYFWDTDPGTGNGSAMLVFDGDDAEAAQRRPRSVVDYHSGSLKICSSTVATRRFKVRSWKPRVKSSMFSRQWRYSSINVVAICPTPSARHLSVR